MQGDTPVARGLCWVAAAAVAATGNVILVIAAIVAIAAVLRGNVTTLLATCALLAAMIFATGPGGALVCVGLGASLSAFMRPQQGQPRGEHCRDEADDSRHPQCKPPEQKDPQAGATNQSTGAHPDVFA